MVTVHSLPALGGADEFVAATCRRRSLISRMHCAGFTLLELLAVLFVIGVLLALLLPAVQQVREAARRTHCQSNLHQFGLAIHNYHDAFQMFPPGNMKGLSLHVAILPYVDQQTLYESYRSQFPDPQSPLSMTSQAINYLSNQSVPLYHCPSDPAGSIHSTNYVGNCGTGVQTYDYNGVFRNASPVKAAEITDGLSNTAAISEWLLGNGDRYDLSRNIWVTPYPLVRADQLEQFAHLCRETATSGVAGDMGKGSAWPDGQLSRTMYNHVLFPNDASCRNGTLVQEGAYSVASLHHGIVHVLAADGHVRGVSANLDLSVWRAFGSRNGDEAVSLP